MSNHWQFERETGMGQPLLPSSGCTDVQGPALQRWCLSCPFLRSHFGSPVGIWFPVGFPRKGLYPKRGFAKRHAVTLVCDLHCWGSGGLEAKDLKGKSACFRLPPYSKQITKHPSKPAKDWGYPDSEKHLLKAVPLPPSTKTATLFLTSLVLMICLCFSVILVPVYFPLSLSYYNTLIPCITEH